MDEERPEPSESELQELIDRARARREFTEGDLEQILEVTHKTDSLELADDLMKEAHQPETEARTADVRAQLGRLTIPGKIKAAMFGNATVRSILIFDPNKMIQDFTLRNPRMSLPEVESFTKNPNLSDHIIRSLSNMKEWTRYYSIKLNIVCNPKTPPDLGMKWLRHLTQADMKKLSKSKNVPSLISTTAGKIVAMQEGK